MPSVASLEIPARNSGIAAASSSEIRSYSYIVLIINKCFYALLIELERQFEITIMALVLYDKHIINEK